ncbi:PAS and ANTAR domain-containing protein [Nocardia sp. NPDC050406]|uniref:PAS and ANTAR domain-containing protein n=1 Tax=Nocardia sp. NPDC050406 TaxID=3364318 RepID=UPI0037AF59B6
MSPNHMPIAEPAGVIDRVLASESCGGVGSFRFWFADHRWEWSDEVARIFGYEPGEVEPTTELLLSHRHPEEDDTMATSVAAALEAGEPICGHHRIIAADGAERAVMAVGDQLTDDDGAIVGVCGYFLDITENLEDTRDEVITELLPGIIESRTAIEQAKGGLSVIYGISTEQAYRVLKWRSQETNTKVRDLAAQLVRDFRDIRGQTPALRNNVDRLVLTVHERVRRDRASD